MPDDTYDINTGDKDIFYLTSWQGHMHCPLDFTLIFPDAGSTAFIESSIITIHDLANLRVNTNDYSLADQ